jgi:hypothetical protein
MIFLGGAAIGLADLICACIPLDAQHLVRVGYGAWLSVSYAFWVWIDQIYRVRVSVMCQELNSSNRVLSSVTSNPGVSGLRRRHLPLHGPRQSPCRSQPRQATKPTRTWILISDGVRARILLSTGAGHGLLAMDEMFLRVFPQPRATLFRAAKVARTIRLEIIGRLLLPVLIHTAR